jgi:MFS family permease
MVVVQAIAPPNLGGRSSALLFLVIVLASGVGPAIVGFLTVYVFEDDAKIGYSLATLFCTAIPLGIVCFLFCLAPLRDAVRAAERRTDMRNLAVASR